MNDEVTIVPAERRDLPVIAALAPGIWQHAYGAILSQEQIAYMLKLMYAPEVLLAAFDRGVKFRLIKSGEETIGFFSFFEYQSDPPADATSKSNDEGFAMPCKYDETDDFEGRTPCGTPRKSGCFGLLQGARRRVGTFVSRVPVLKLDKLYLLPAFHGRGIGSLALRSLTECASDAGYGKIRLNVNKNNLRAIAAYTRNGFKKKESVKNDIGNGFFMDDYVMEKKLM